MTNAPMHSINEHPLPTAPEKELLNPSFIARIASRLFNELPETGNLPRNESDVRKAPGYAASTINDHVEHPAASTPLPVASGECFGKTFDQQPELPWFPEEAPAIEGHEFYFLPSVSENREEPLEHHANKLTDQQTYQGNAQGSSGIEPILNRNAPSKPLTETGIQKRNLQRCDPVFQALGSGLPTENDMLFRLIYDPTPRLQPEELPAGLWPDPARILPVPAGSYYFLNEPPPSPVTRTDIFDVASIRRDFPVLQQNIHGKPLVWLDNAATTQKPLSVINAVSEFYSSDNSNIHRGAHTLAARATDAYEDAREKIRQFIGAGSTSEIIYVRGTTEAINLVAQTWGRTFIQPGDEIVLSILEHHANIVPWQMLAREKGARIRVVPVDERGEILLDEYTRLLGPRTRFVSLTQASNGLGTILPVQEMIRLAKRFDAKVLIDGAQSVAHIPVNVQDLDADFFVFSGHKIFAPTGTGVLYGKRELLEVMPPWQGGGNMIRDVRFEETIYNEPPAKFEAGTPSIGDAVGLGAALDYVRNIGLDNIARYEHELTGYATERLGSIPGLRLIGTARNKVGVLSFILHNVPNDEVGKLLDREGIAVRTGHHCTQPSLRRFGLEGTVRPSLAFYNTKEEIDHLADVIRSVQRR